MPHGARPKSSASPSPSRSPLWIVSNCPGSLHCASDQGGSAKVRAAAELHCLAAAQRVAVVDQRGVVAGPAVHSVADVIARVDDIVAPAGADLVAMAVVGPDPVPAAPAPEGVAAPPGAEPVAPGPAQDGVAAPPARSRSCPLRPQTRSSPRPAQIRSRRRVPTSTSSPREPWSTRPRESATLVAALPSQLGPGWLPEAVGGGSRISNTSASPDAAPRPALTQGFTCRPQTPSRP